MTIKNKRKAQFRMQALMEKRKKLEHELLRKMNEEYQMKLMYGKNYKENNINN
jgi:hypothetical protein